MSGPTYEVYIDVRHHPRHMDDYECRESTAFKLVDTGQPQRMVLNALRAFADDLEARWEREASEARRQQERADALSAWEDQRRPA